tara:strand:- start:387 stop:911 length:525 start_codon:yes stop_codon:yes gene_type:complete
MTNLDTTTKMVTPLEALIDVLNFQEALTSKASKSAGKMDTMLEAFVSYENDGIKLIDTWSEIYETEGWAYKEYDVDTGEVIPVEGSKAPSKVSTYKSQMFKAFKLNNKSLTGLRDWADLKAIIKKVDTQLEIDAKFAMNALQVAVKKAIKDNKLNTSWIDQATSHIANNDGILD